MAEFFAVFNAGEALGTTPVVTNVDKNSDTLKSAKFVKVTGTAVADVQAYILARYGGSTSTPVVVEETAWKTS